MPCGSVHKVASRFLIARGYFEPGDIISFGKFGNRYGQILGFGKDVKDNPTVIIQPVTSKGSRKRKPKELRLYRIKHAEPMVKLAHLYLSAKYKDKSKIKTEDGETKTIYEYSERQVALRNNAKADKVESLRYKMSDLRKQVKQDLDAKDPKTKLTALAIMLIDQTYERVGNEESAENGHYGVTGWLGEHVSFTKDKAVFKYVGKSGVKHEKEVTDKKLVSVLKDLKDKNGNEDLLLQIDDCAISARDVNAYLEDFDISAKDLRGFHANREMQEGLRKIRKENGSLPKDKKEKESQLKKEFLGVLDEVADIVGHLPTTLRNQYLVPGLEDSFMQDGTVITSFNER